MKADKIVDKPNQRGVKLFIKKKHVKTIPKRLLSVALTDFISDLSTKRLNDVERLSLETSFFVESLKKYEKELVMGCEVVLVRIVKNYYGEQWYEAVFSNKVRVKCGKPFFNLFPNKQKEISFFN